MLEEIFFLLESIAKFLYSSDWFKKIENLSEEQFKENFRLARSQFNLLYTFIINNLPHINKNLMEHLYISHIKIIREMRELFGIPKSTIWWIIFSFNDVLYVIAIQEIKLPNFDEFNTLS